MTHLRIAALSSVRVRHSLVPKFLPADAQRVAVWSLGDNENLLGPVLHQLVQVLR